ncbi:bifunctional proline dehydrogenase/L-glutamate gamma-semialdehyde dehydrogenase PutA [Catenovulum maritimum]|uniref:Bifunctional protein PutA n=1 Tax=Catenovulum maritimum TaxID=1513271 RepID=A0A0J8GVQ9_9ALTE|nr:bifunctional proline dehydrogenase/L-glutamate gamma-semialdehyde dehydrogenase PutA [Catenovulum maritimum]KMT66837.1 transcriptional regulator [Catenovulum maritimum]
MLFNGKLITECPIRQKIRDFYRIDENIAVDLILPDAEVSMAARSRAWARARDLVLNIRKIQENNHGIDALLNEYSLSSAEGVVLMCLAEALLRVPDKATQDELIRDKISKGHWTSHLGQSESLFVNASSWGLLITGNMVKYADNKSQHNLLKQLMGRLGEPVIRKAMNIAMKLMGKQFVMGETIKDAVERAQQKESTGYVYSYDMLGEGARTREDANLYFKAYADAIKVIGTAAKGKGPRLSPGISVKLSALEPRYETSHYQHVMQTLPVKLKQLCLLAKFYDIGLTVDAEESERLEISLDIIENVFTDPELSGWTGFGIAVQAYQKRALFVIDWLRQLTIKTRRKMMVRLVKGAYWDSEIKQAQKDGLKHYPVFTRKSSTDVSYHACANRLLDYRDTIYPQFATHNAYTASVIIELAGDDKQGFEFQCLHGMGDGLYNQIVEELGIQCRVYAPVGGHEGLLAYLVRRLLENGANSSFVNAIVDESKPVETLLYDPVEKTQNLTSKYNTQILKPVELYGSERDNSKGLDLSDFDQVYSLKLLVERSLSQIQYTENLGLAEVSDQKQLVRNPANLNEVIGFHTFDKRESMLAKLNQVDSNFLVWSQTDVKLRADLLNRVADIFERHMPDLIALCIKEAGKVTQDGIDEVREAVDFCRYYAAQAIKLSQDERLVPRGVVLCISPWNFPLAIFIGQVAAAISVGNTVIAKSAEQTSLIAKRALELMESVGLPKGVVELIVAQGSEVGKVLLPDDRIKAVMFTGSTETAQVINQALAKRGGDQVPLIAETGGQNCMIVDSTALHEQVVDDVISSGFKSAGQRCSALRVLYLQQDIADDVIKMLIGAMKTLTLDDPAYLSTDIGPVIDDKALSNLTQHAEKMQQFEQEGMAKLLYQVDLPVLASQAYFFPASLYLIDSIKLLEREVFGPCVHIVKFKAEELNQVIEKINQTGYGLTMGIHSRIESRAVDLAAKSKAGNIYINRNMIGAVVGVQPFGGRGLSGTGPKAGGPNYLSRLMKEKSTIEFTPQEYDLVQPSLQSDAQAILEAAQLMLKANQAETAWRHTDLNSRLSVVRQLLAKIATVDKLDEFADDLDRTLARSRSQLIQIEKQLKTSLVLPGPTGESNTLSLEPRGILVCFADKDVTFEYWTLSIVTALATGNIVITVVSDLFYQEALAFKDKFDSTGADSGVLQVAKLKHTQALLESEQLKGVVVDSHSLRSAYFAMQLAKRKADILPVISAEYNDNLIKRLVTEKCISIDTTASGGNTSLMTLVEEEN